MRLLLAIFFIFCATNFYAQRETDPIGYFKDLIISGEKPTDKDIYVDYNSTMREIVWNESLIKSYHYSNEVLDRNGFEYVKTYEGDNNQNRKIYRICEDGIILKITEWYNLKFSISIMWFPIDIRPSIGYLIFCNKNESEEEIMNEVYESFKAEAINDYNNKTISYSDRKNKPKLINGNDFMKSYFYKIIQPENEYRNEELTILLNKDGTIDLEICKENKYPGKYSGYDISKKEDYETYSSFINSELKNLIFTNPPDTIYGKSLIPKTDMYVEIHSGSKNIGIIKVYYDPESNQIDIKKNESGYPFNNDEILDYLKNSKKGNYKLNCYYVVVKMTLVWDVSCTIHSTKFIAFN